MMVWHEAQFGEVTAVLIDGFAPPLEVFAALDLWDRRITQRRDGVIPAKVYWDRIHKYVRPSGIPHEGQLLAAFGAAAMGIRHGWCPYIDPHEPPYYSGDPRRCFYQYYTAGPNRRSLETDSWQRTFRGKPARLTREYDDDREKGRSAYISNVLVYRSAEPDACGYARDCCQNWIDALHFDIKDGDGYLDVADFRTNWSPILEQHVGMYHSILRRYRAGLG